MKKILAVAAIMCGMGYAGNALAADFAFHGDLDHRFQVYTNHADFLDGDKFSKGGGIQVDNDANDSWGEVKYRLWAEMASDDKAVKGVYAIEIGGLEFGKPGSVGKSVGGNFSGDGVNVETRWAYLDMQMPGVSDKMRIKTGLQPFNLNKYFWKETIMGINVDGKSGNMSYFVGWERPYRVDAKSGNTDVDDVDALVAKVSFSPMEKSKIGFFASYMFNDAKLYDVPGKSEKSLAKELKSLGVATTNSHTGAQKYKTIGATNWEIKKFAQDVDLDLYTLGLTGKMNFGGFFTNWDLIYQGGSIDNAVYLNEDNKYWGSSAGPAYTDFDVSSWFAHFDVGTKVGATKITGTYIYASGDDDATDDEINAYLAADVDMGFSQVITEGHPTSDDYFTERPYILDKGIHVFKLAVDNKVSKKVKVGGALLYMMTAEDVTYTGANGAMFSDDGIGTEIDAYVKYKLYPDVTLSFNAGYLFVDDAMDYFESDLDGSADEDVYTLGARLRYKF